jgi:hypothetical protein
MCSSGATCLFADCCFSDLALYKSNSACCSSTKRTSSLIFFYVQKINVFFLFPVKKYIAVREMFCRSVIVLFLLAIVLPALALGDLKTLLALFLKQKRGRTFTWLDPIQWKKIRVQFSVRFNLVWKLVCNFTPNEVKKTHVHNQCNQMAIALPTWCPWSETLRNMTVGTVYREDGSEHNRF